MANREHPQNKAASEQFGDIKIDGRLHSRARRAGT
jgi:hypothetical protein